MACALTLAVLAVPSFRFAYEAPGLHVAIDSSAGIVGAVTAFLLVGRLLRSRRRSDLILTLALAVFAVANLALSAVPAALAPDGRGTFATWAPLVARLGATVALAAAAVAPDRSLRRPGRVALLAAAAVATGLVGVAAAIVVAAPALPDAVDGSISPADSTAPLVAGNAVVLAVQGLQVALFALAALGFARRAERERDELLAWLAAGAAVAAFARLNYLLFPSLYSDWVYTGDVLRFAFYAILLAGCAREIRAHWRAAERAAVLEERRRIARDLHDGLAQELAFIAMQTRRLARMQPDEPVLAQLTSAADRGLGEARRAIEALAREDDGESLPAAVAEIADEISFREGLQLDLELADDVDVAPEVREELVRVVREAMTNAARHADATRVRLELRNADGVHLVVADDGAGFDPAIGAGGGGFGLTSMAERVRLLGGDLRVLSTPGTGTRVEVQLP